MILYHGSNIPVTKIDISKSKPGKSNHQYDFVYGPIADDKVGRQLRRFFDEDIEKNELLERLKYMKGITYQYYFGTEEALKYLTGIE